MFSVVSSTMYWTDWGASPKIEQAGMDGSARKTIVTRNLGWPNGLTIDQATNRLFWADAKLDTIESSDLTGANRHLILSSSSDIHPYGLTVHQGMLYWTDWNTKSISRFNLSNASKEEIVSGLQKPMDIHVFDPSLIFSGTSINFFFISEIRWNEAIIYFVHAKRGVVTKASLRRDNCLLIYSFWIILLFWTFRQLGSIKMSVHPEK